MMSDDLVERVARAIGESLRTARLTLESEGYHPEARAAIAVVLEEAAKEAEKWYDPYKDDPGDANLIAAAIRALIKEDKV